jgi:membrane protease YdiL (CAAX protease family)
MASSSLLLGYLVSILPAGLLALVALLAIPRALAGARLAVHILFFIFARDAMSPAGFWQLGAGSMRLTAPVPVLLALAGMSAALFVGVAWLERVTWWEGWNGWKGVRLVPSLLWGVAGAVAISVVAAALKAAAGLPSLPAPDTALVVPLLVFALLGNAYEELLFRGMLQQRLMAHMSAARAVVVSGALFSLCHAWLALIVTRAGLPVLVFTLVEGLVAGLVYRRAGLLAATLAHGLAIFVLASGAY